MSNSGALYDALLARHSASAKNISAPGPSPGQVERIVFAGSRAPDHGRLAPFRFVAIPDSQRDRFAQVLGAAALELQPDISAPELARSTDKAHQGPCLIGIIARIDAAHPKIPASDQWLTVGCALENMLLAAQSEGFGVAVRSGRFLETQAFAKGFSLAANEHFVCFLAIGTVSEWPPAKPKPALNQVFTTWAG